MNIDQSAMCYTSMDSTQQALQNNGRIFSNFKFVSELMGCFYFLLLLFSEYVRGLQ